MDTPSPDLRRGQKARFTAALVVFAGWVAALGVMAFTSGRPPQAKSAPADPAPASAPPADTHAR